jgi:hypothetical protein
MQVAAQTNHYSFCAVILAAPFHRLQFSFDLQALSETLASGVSPLFRFLPGLFVILFNNYL